MLNLTKLFDRAERINRTTLRKRGIINEQIIHPAILPITRVTGIRKAYVKTTPGAVTTVTCYLDTDSTGDEITVTCSVVGGSALNSAIPRLTDGDLIFVSNIDSTWYCLTVFQTSEDCDCYEAS